MYVLSTQKKLLIKLRSDNIDLQCPRENGSADNCMDELMIVCSASNPIVRRGRSLHGQLERWVISPLFNLVITETLMSIKRRV